MLYVLGSALRIGFPLPEHLPNASRSRDRLLARVFEYRQRVKNKGGGEGEVGDEDFAVVYAYVLVTARIGEGLEELEREMTKLYGVLEDRELEI